MTIKGELRGTAPFIMQLKKLAAEAPDLVGKAMNTSAEAILVPDMKRRIRKKKLVYTGGMFQRIRSETSEEGLVVTTRVGAIAVPYAGMIEFGGPPRAEPYSRIRDWLSKKEGLSGPALDAKTRAVYTSIIRRGTIAHPFVGPTWKARRIPYFKDVLARLKFAIASR